MTLKAVQKAIASGRIDLTENGKIDPVLADKQWSANTDISRASIGLPAPVPPSVASVDQPGLVLTGEAGGSLFNKLLDLDPVQSAAGDQLAPEEPADTRDADSEEYRKHRATREKYNALKQEAEFKQLIGELINKDFAVQSAFTAFRALRDSVLNVPARIKEHLAALSDSEAIETMLEEELSLALKSVNLSRMFTDDELE